MDEALDRAQQPATLLQAAGVLTMVFYGLYAAMSVLGLLMNCMNFGFSTLSLLGGDTASAAMAMGMSGWVLLFQFVGLVVWGALAFGGFRVFGAAAAVRELRDLEMARQGMVFSAGIPVVGLIANVVLSLFTFSFCGLVFYTVPQILVLGLGGAAAWQTNELLQDEGIVSLFA